MIRTEHLTKRFGDVTALRDVTTEIREGSIFGLIGTNGAGKSTFLKLLSGILTPEEGRIEIDGSPVFENPSVKSLFFYISDDMYFLPNACGEDMRRFYTGIYPNFDSARFHSLMQSFSLDEKRKVAAFSKGMKKQLAVILGLSAGTKYLLCDETFDGLDPVMRQAVKSLFAEDLAERGLTPIIASHNLRELEDICDHVGLLHNGGILFSRDLDDMKLNMRRVQCILKPEQSEADLSSLDILTSVRRGSLVTMTIRGSEEEIEAKLRAASLLFYEMLPLTLEEIFICETEAEGYDIKNLILSSDH